MGAAFKTEEPDIGSVMLATGVHTAGDIYPHTAHFCESFGLELVTDGLGQASGLTDR